jgi:hypothetical protein
VVQIALTSNNRFLVTAGVRFLRVWDLATGKERRRWPLPVAMKEFWGQTFVTRLCLLSDGQRAVTALADGTALVWDLTPALQRPTKARKPGNQELDQWWADLAREDGRKAYAAVWSLIEAPEAAVSLLRRLKPAEAQNVKQIIRHIKDLDSDDFKVREKAFEALERLGPVAVPALQEALRQKPSLEVRRRLEQLLSRTSISPEVLRSVRGIAVLDKIGSKEAQCLLAELARGTEHARQTQEAKAALERLARGRGK